MRTKYYPLTPETGVRFPVRFKMRFFICTPLAKKRALQKMERPRVLSIFLQSWFQDNSRYNSRANFKWRGVYEEIKCPETSQVF